ncbi:heat shock 70 kDa protein 12A-like [Mizuhopecten yessoensis]|uniref:heat shock 70 kDa protein 12A-like n=1 Tax=Mizuhopecten yessoensis TaxID=6573 RepID=UPI000B457261|nr:heat shock 70 kDa protein 12A-like [Mizuhopecten yessoensis]
MSVDEDSNRHLPLAVVAIDFGTTYTGYAYSSRNEFQKSKSNCAGIINHNNWASGFAGLYSFKAPTVALFNSEKEFDCFGYEAEDKYARLAENKVHHKWYYFSRFKMQLFDKMKLSRDFAIADQLGKCLPAIDVFSESIKYLAKAAKKEFVNAGQDNLVSDIIWVITVPAIWNEPAKQFMRQAAIKAGIDKDNLMLALEPEAAALYCRYLPGKEANDIRSYFHGGRYMVVDMGGK